MAKNLISFLMLSWLFSLGVAPALAQQNEKVVFPTPANYQTSGGSAVVPTSDGGYLVTGSVDGTDWNTFGMLVQPRVIKLDANLNTVWDNLYIPLSLPFGEFAFPKGDAFELPDGDFLLGLHNDSSDVHVLRLNADGSLQAEISFPGLYERFAQVMDLMDNGNALVYLQANTPSIKHLDNNGNVVYDKAINFQGIEHEPILLSNGDLLFRKFNFNQLTRTDNLGNIIWQIQPVAGLYSGMLALPNGGFGLYFYAAGKWHIRFYDAAGVETGLSAALSIPEDLISLRAYPDGSFLASGSTVTNRGFLLRINADGTLVWSAESPEDGQPPLVTVSGTLTTDGWAVGAASTTTVQMGFMRVSANTGFFVNTLTGKIQKDNDESCTADAGEPGIYHAKVRANNGTEIFESFSNGQGEYQLLLPSGNYTLSSWPNEPFFFQCPTALNTVSFPPNANNSAVLDLPIQSLDLIHQIKGKVTLDQSNDCVADLNDPAAGLWDLRLEFATGYINLKTDNNGEYQIFVPSGDYTLEVFPWNANFDICGQAERTFSLLGTGPLVQTEDYLVYPETNCPQMRLDIGGNSVRPCSTRVVSIYYQNQGTVVAEDQFVEVTLDNELEFISSTPTPVSVSGNTVLFDIGDVGPSPNTGGWHELKVSVKASCNLQIGQQACMSAALTQASPCQHPSTWQGAIITVEGECSSTSDSIIFKIKNIGNGPNTGIQEFIIDEDQIVLLQGTFQLPAGGEQIEAVLPMSNTSTVSITAEQEPGAPGDTLVTYSLTNCVGMSGGSPSGLGGNAGPFSTSQCFQVANSYDPNDKTASPLGFGPEHLVHPGTPLEYTIRFQNTGNDTAFLVVLRDTLSAKLDRSRIQLLGASHPYEFAQINDSILHIRFDNILLPDSMTNPEASQGFISFKIYPQPELPNGTVVNNHAAIYFDQNPPIITNTVWRTYGEYFVVSTTEEINPQRVRVNVSPNPFVNEARFELQGEVSGETYQLEIFDATGKLLRRLPFSDNICRLGRENLSSGLHFWSVSEAGKVLASGKILAGN